MPLTCIARCLSICCRQFRMTNKPSIDSCLFNCVLCVKLPLDSFRSCPLHTPSYPISLPTRTSQLLPARYLHPSRCYQPTFIHMYTSPLPVMLFACNDTDYSLHQRKLNNKNNHKSRVPSMFVVVYSYTRSHYTSTSAQDATSLPLQQSDVGLQMSQLIKKKARVAYV